MSNSFLPEQPGLWESNEVLDAFRFQHGRNPQNHFQKAEEIANELFEYIRSHYGDVLSKKTEAALKKQMLDIYHETFRQKEIEMALEITKTKKKSRKYLTGFAPFLQETPKETGEEAAGKTTQVVEYELEEETCLNPQPGLQEAQIQPVIQVSEFHFSSEDTTTFNITKSASALHEKSLSLTYSSEPRTVSDTHISQKAPKDRQCSPKDPEPRSHSVSPRPSKLSKLQNKEENPKKREEEQVCTPERMNLLNIRRMERRQKFPNASKSIGTFNPFRNTSLASDSIHGSQLISSPRFPMAQDFFKKQEENEPSFSFFGTNEEKEQIFAKTRKGSPEAEEAEKPKAKNRKTWNDNSQLRKGKSKSDSNCSHLLKNKKKPTGKDQKAFFWGNKRDSLERKRKEIGKTNEKPHSGETPETGINLNSNYSFACGPGFELNHS